MRLIVQTEPGVVERFLKKVERTDTCWVWTAGIHKSGYGHFWLAGTMVYAHRASWLLHKGPIPDGLDVLHKCDNPKCVRPDHLFLGTHLDNMRDRDKKGRRTAPKGSAHGGAVLTEEVVLGIRARVAVGESRRSVAEEVGVSYSMVCRIVSGKNWTHVGGLSCA